MILVKVTWYICNIYRHSLWTVAPTNLICFTAYISLAVGRILIKLGENVGTSVRLIALKFYKNRFCVDVSMTSFFFFLKLFLRKATLLKEQQLWTKANNSEQSEIKMCANGNNSVQRETIMLRQTVTQATAILLH